MSDKKYVSYCTCAARTSENEVPTFVLGTAEAARSGHGAADGPSPERLDGAAAVVEPW